MTEQAAKTEHFLALHQGPGPLLLPNASDRGSAALLTSLGFAAIATTSSGFAATLGRLDGQVTRDEALGHAVDIAAATPLPLAPPRPAHGIRPAWPSMARGRRPGWPAAGSRLTGQGSPDELGAAAERVAAAAEAAHGGTAAGGCLVLTARAENYLHGRPDLKDTMSRLPGLPGCGCRRPLRARPHPAGGHPPAAGVGRPAGQRAHHGRRAGSA